MYLTVELQEVILELAKTVFKIAGELLLVLVMIMVAIILAGYNTVRGY